MADDEEGIHMHCLTCHRADCIKFQNCPIIPCENECGIQFHSCKQKDHLLVCRNQRTNFIPCENECGIQFHSCKQKDHLLVCRNQVRPCVNRINGCPVKLDSVLMMTHLELCPASVIHCGMNWNRYPLFSQVRQQWLPFFQGNPVQVEGDLDTELAISDQLHLQKEMGMRMRKGKLHTRDKRLKIRLDKSRMKKLESLLSGVKLKTDTSQKDGEDSCCINESSNQNPFEEEDSPLITYDEAVTSKSDITTFVTNTNIRGAYSDTPNQSDYYSFISPSTKKEIVSISTNSRSDDDLTSEEMKRRRDVYSKTKHLNLPLGLNVVLEKLPRFQAQYPMYNFSCSKVFRRDQYGWHCLNVHGQIQDNLQGTLFQRCPLWQYGCPFLQYLLKPKNGRVRFYKPFSSFTSTCDEAFDNTPELYTPSYTSLLDLHYDILLYLLSFLDNMSLNCLAKTCHAMKNLCYDILDKKGVVIPIWSKKTYANGGSSWQIEEKVRLFTTSCSPIYEWVHTGAPPIGQHMATCAYFKRPEMKERVRLPIEGPNFSYAEVIDLIRP